MSDVNPRILEGLNPPQREAVETIHGPLLILAGAGSGKTRVVTRRIANLIAHGARPWEILAITFTNKAAGEMRNRVEDLVGQAGVWVSTFHSFCARLLRREAEHLGYSRDFTIYDEEDASGTLKDILKRLGLNEDKRFAPKIVRGAISNFKSQALKPEDIDEGNYEDRLLQKIYYEYQGELQKSQAFDFDDLLRMAVVLFREHPDVLERYRHRFKYILVDEYQDTNGCQYHIVKMLGLGHRNVCATGDPDQSIYAWRGADVRNILSFEQDFPEAKIVKLEQNYRSTQRILDAAGAVIENNTERKKKRLWTENAEGDRITLTVVSDETLEAYEVAKRTERHVREGRRYSEIAVFYRTNSQSRAIETSFIQAGIPYQLVGGTAFYERREIKDALSYLRLIVNPKDDVAFRRIINVPKRGLGDSAIELIEQQAEKLGCSLLDTLDNEHTETFIDIFKPKARQGMIQFARLIDKLRAMPQFPVEDVLEAVLSHSGLRDSLSEAGENERVENLDELRNAAAEFDKDNDPKLIRVPDGPPPEPGAFDGIEEMQQKQASVAGFLENSALLAPTDSFDPLSDRVTLMTLHMAKGLEFPVVFMTGLEEGLMPLLRSSGPDAFGMKEEDEKAIEEERRLMYVGVTRAMEKLYLSRTQFRRRYGKSDNALPSRFLDEIPEKLLDVEDRSLPVWGQAYGKPLTRQVVREKESDEDAFQAFEKEVASVFGDDIEKKRSPSSSSSRRHDPALQSLVDRMLEVSEGEESQENPGMVEVGDNVRHAQFGDGIVEAITGIGLSTKVKVHFRGVGPKQLLLSMAKLKKL